MTAFLPSIADFEPNPTWAKLPLFDRTSCKRVRVGVVVENCNKLGIRRRLLWLKRRRSLSNTSTGLPRRSTTNCPRMTACWTSDAARKRGQRGPGTISEFNSGGCQQLSPNA